MLHPLAPFVETYFRKVMSMCESVSLPTSHMGPTELRAAGDGGGGCAQALQI